MKLALGRDSYCPCPLLAKKKKMYWLQYRRPIQTQSICRDIWGWLILAWIIFQSILVIVSITPKTLNGILYLTRAKGGGTNPSRMAGWRPSGEKKNVINCSVALEYKQLHLVWNFLSCVNVTQNEICLARFEWAVDFSFCSRVRSVNKAINGRFLHGLNMSFL